MVAIISLLVIVLLSIIVVRIGGVALELTGLSSDIASFQAQSAFSGVGFTTMESEAIVKHPVRRRIIRVLILLGSAGVTTSIATLVIAFVGQSTTKMLVRAEFLLAGLLFIYLFARSRHISRAMKRIFTLALEKWTTLQLYDYEEMFGLSEGYAITKVTIKKDSSLLEKSLKDLRTELGDILVLGIYRKVDKRRQLIGAPHGEEIIRLGDELICYAREDVVNKAFAKAVKKEEAAPV